MGHQLAIALLSIFLLTSFSNIKTKLLCKGVAPENNLYIGTDAKEVSKMTESEFNNLLSKFQTLYSPIVQGKGGRLAIEGAWKNGTVNAYAYQAEDDWFVKIFGGLARHRLMTKDALALVVCHELGHHVGGAPKFEYLDGVVDWATIEGQADYYASLKCMRLAFGNDDNVSAIADAPIPQEVLQRCEESFDAPNAYALCLRGALAGRDLARVLASLGGTGGSGVNFDTPDTYVVEVTDEEHPSAQCRLDTFFAASQCQKSETIDVDDRDPRIGTCNISTGELAGSRPACWYHEG